MDEKQIKFFIEKIAVETNSLATVSVWQEWIYDIASSKSIDRISFDRETLTAYFGCLSPAFAELCDFLIKNYGSRSKKGEFPRFELSHNALNRKHRK